MLIDNKRLVSGVAGFDPSGRWKQPEDSGSIQALESGLRRCVICGQRNLLQCDDEVSSGFG